MIEQQSAHSSSMRLGMQGLDELDLMNDTGKTIISVLVVDRDPAFLDEIRHVESLSKHGWVLRACSSGQEAIAAMEEARIDLYVAGADLGDMEGATYLRLAKERHPNALRFFLHEADDRAGMAKSTGLAHRRLQKPISGEEIAYALRQVLVTHLRIRKKEVSSIVRNTEQLHVNTAPMQELLATADDPTCDIEKLCSIVSKHPTAVASVLHIANTAFYGASGGVDSIEEALPMLGMDFVRNMAITELAKKQLRLSPGLQELANAILQHSIEASQYGYRLRRYVKNVKLVQQLCSLALLHDLGKLVLLAQKGSDYADLMGQSVDSGTPCWRLERATYGCDHAAVGGFLFAMWGLPEVIVRAVTWHHQPEKVAEKGFCPVSLLHFANYAAHANQGVSCYSGDRLNEDLAVRLGLAPDFVLEVAE